MSKLGMVLLGFIRAGVFCLDLFIIIDSFIRMAKTDIASGLGCALFLSYLGWFAPITLASVSLVFLLRKFICVDIN